MKRILAIGGVVLGLLAAVVLLLRLRTPGPYLEDRTGAPVLTGAALEKVVDLDHPPGNVAVSDTGRVFFTLHPDGDPPGHVYELIDGKPVEFPRGEDPAFPGFGTVLSLRIDRQGRLWTLDHGFYALTGTPRLLAFDLATGRVVHRFDFPSAVAPTFSMLNDFQVDPTGTKIFIAEASPIVGRPALVVYDVDGRTARRVLQRHPSVMPEDYVLRVGGRDMTVYGLLSMRIGVDSIALDRQGEWLYYGPVNGATLYRLPAAALADPKVDDLALNALVEPYAPKTLSDGLSTDLAGNVYLTDPEHSAIVQVTPARELVTVVRDPRLRWPDGLSFGPDGWLYVSCSSLQDVLFVSGATMRAAAPFQIWRFKPGPSGIPGQ